ncbi:MAG: hypothetical protein AAF362_10400 [Pseudomonadota bacterium]
MLKFIKVERWWKDGGKMVERIAGSHQRAIGFYPVNERSVIGNSLPNLFFTVDESRYRGNILRGGGGDDIFDLTTKGSAFVEGGPGEDAVFFANNQDDYYAYYGDEKKTLLVIVGPGKFFGRPDEKFTLVVKGPNKVEHLVFKDSHGTIDKFLPGLLERAKGRDTYYPAY